MWVNSKKDIEYKSNSVQFNLDTVPSDLSDRFRQTQDSINDEILYYELGPDSPGEEYGKEDEPHITVLYGLSNDSQNKEIVEFLKGCKPFEITFGNASLFPGRGEDGKKSKPYDVVKVEIDGEGLHALNEELTRHFEIKGQTFPEYKPHCTLAYVKVDSLDPQEVKNFLYGEVATVRKLHFSMSGNRGSTDVQLYGGEEVLSETTFLMDRSKARTFPHKTTIGFGSLVVAGRLYRPKVKVAQAEMLLDEETGKIR